MRYPISIHEKVRTLRGQGKTYSEILKIIGVKIPKSTLSDWCRSVILPSWYLQKIEGLNKASFSKALSAAHASLIFKREKMLKRFETENSEAIHNFKGDYVYKIALSILHLGEGAKWKSHSGLLLGSSDPLIVQLYLYLLSRCYGIDAATLKCRICCRADQNIHELQEYWSNITSIPLKNFYKTTFDKRTIGKPTRNGNYKGVCVIMGRGTEIQLELESIPGLILKKLKQGR